MNSPSHRATFNEFNSTQIRSNSRLLSHAPRRDGTYVHVPSSTVVQHPRMPRERLNAATATPNSLKGVRRRLHFLEDDSDSDWASPEQTILASASPSKDETSSNRRKTRKSMQNLSDDSGVFSTGDRQSHTQRKAAFSNYRFMQLIMTDSESSSCDESAVDRVDHPITPVTIKRKITTVKRASRKRKSEQSVAVSSSPASKKGKRVAAPRLTAAKSRPTRQTAKRKQVATDSVTTSPGPCYSKRVRTRRSNTLEKEAKLVSEQQPSTEEFGLILTTDLPSDGRCSGSNSGPTEEELVQAKKRETHIKLRSNVGRYHNLFIGVPNDGDSATTDLNDSTTSAQALTDISMVVDDDFASLTL